MVERGRREGAFPTDVATEWLITSFLALIHAAADEVRIACPTTIAPTHELDPARLPGSASHIVGLACRLGH